MMGRREPMRDGWEVDAFSWHRCLHFNAGVRSYTKRRYNKRVRRLIRNRIRSGAEDLL